MHSTKEVKKRIKAREQARKGEKSQPPEDPLVQEQGKHLDRQRLGLVHPPSATGA